MFAVLPDDCVLQVRDAEFSWQAAPESGPRSRSSSTGVHKGVAGPSGVQHGEPTPSGVDIGDSKVLLSKQEIEISQEEIEEATLSLVDLNFHVLKVTVFKRVCFFIQHWYIFTLLQVTCYRIVANLKEKCNF